MDAYSGYNQIKIESSRRAKNNFHDKQQLLLRGDAI